MATTTEKKFTTTSVFGTGDGEFTPEDFAKLTATDLSIMTGTQAATLTADYLAALKPYNISGLIHVLKYIPSDALEGFTRATIAAIPVYSLSPDIISALSIAIPSFNFTETTDIKTLSNFDIGMLSYTQLSLLTPNQAAEFTADQASGLFRLSAVSKVFSYFSQNAIKGMQPGAMYDLPISSMSAEQVQWLTENQLSALTASQVASFSKEQFLSIQPSSIAYLNIKKLPISILTLDQIQGLTIEQLSKLSPQQVNSFDSNQISALGVVQSEIFNAVKDKILSNKADITDFLDFAHRRFDSHLDGLNVNDDFSNLIWSSPTYDANKPSYNLTFNAAKTENNPASVFTISHQVTGDYIGANYDTNKYDGNHSNGSVDDSIIASYGDSDKTTFTISEEIKTQLDGLSKETVTYNQNSISSNNTPNNKNDDFIKTRVDKYSDIFSVKTQIRNENNSISDVYKSKNLNYSISWNTSTNFDNAVDHSEKDKFTDNSKLTYLKNDIDGGSIISANYSYSINYSVKNSIENYETVYSSAFFKIDSNDNNDAYLSFSGKQKHSNDIISNNISNDIILKSFTLESSNLKMTSSAFSAAITENFNHDLGILTYYGHYNGDSKDEDDIDRTPINLINWGVSAFQNLNQGNNNITIKNSEGLSVDAGAGKDTVIGAVGDDTIIGGAGSDKLTGGKGTDTFTFSNADFYTENADGDSVFNKSVDTITDFNLKEHDVLDFGDLGELSFYAKLADAKADNAHLFYVKGSGSIYLNTNTTDGFTPTVIITLTGKPALNADGTDWNYPA